LGKYPPIQGGVSTSNYWLTRALASKGHKVFVVTNAEEVAFEHREEISHRDTKYLEPENTKVFNTKPLSRQFIPEYVPFVTKLASLAIEVIKREKVDVLYSNYLLPYGVAAGMVKDVTGIPWFLDHAGSDITNLFDEELLRPVFVNLFKKADTVVNSMQVKGRLIDTNIISRDKISPFIDKMFYAKIISKIYTPDVKPMDLGRYFKKFDKKFPVFTFLGKISSLKKTFEFVKAAALLPRRRFYLLFVTQRGRMYLQLKNILSQYGLLDNSYLMNFQPPWRIPCIMTASTCIVAPESEEMPYLPEGTHGSKICLEAMLCGRCAVVGICMSKKGFYAQCKDKEHLLVVDPHDIKAFAKKLKLIVDDPNVAYKIGRRARKFLASKNYLTPKETGTFIKNLTIPILKGQ